MNRDLKSFPISIDGIDNIQMVRSHRAKRLSICITPFKGIRVTIPQGVSIGRAKKFVNAKIGWIKKNIDRTHKIEQQSKFHNSDYIKINPFNAKQKIIYRLNLLAEKNGFIFNRLSIKNQKTIWGSCSGRNNINLNIKLITLPQELMDYVILHELVHTKVKNHSEDFWNELSRYVNEPKKLRRRLKDYNHILYKPSKV